MLESTKDDHELPTAVELWSYRRPTRKRRKKGGCLGRLREPFRRDANLMLLISFALFVSSFLSTAYNVLYVKTEAPLTHSCRTLVNNFWPTGLLNRTDNWADENSKVMRGLMSCMSTNACRENQTSIVLLSSIHFAGWISGRVSGEDIWAGSIIDALRQMNYSPIFTTSNAELSHTYRQFPDLVKVIIIDGQSVQECFKSDKCVKTATHPLGVPAWKMLSFHFWLGSRHPLGTGWTLSPENYDIISPSKSTSNVYLGYSIENTCLQIPVTPVEERPRQAYVLAKKIEYFGKDYTWAEIALDQSPFDVKLVSGLRPHDSSLDSYLPKGIIDLGQLSKTEFYHNLGRSRVLVGIGLPLTSPSPYDALCMGVPFINPITRWDKNDPENRTSWTTQHDGMKLQNPPYVYNVKKGDREQFWNALQKAMDNPIERYIIPEMTMNSLMYRLGKIIEDDWKSKAKRLLDERKALKIGEIFEL